MSTSAIILIAVVVNRLACAILAPDDSQHLRESTLLKNSSTIDLEQRSVRNLTDETKIFVTDVWTAAPEIMGRCAESVLTDMPNNIVDQNGTGDAFFASERLTDFLDHADHIYIICMQCKRALPTKLAKKASILNGRVSDECFAGEGIRFYGGTFEHHQRVTFAHRLAITDAKAKNFKVVLVLEEDAIFKADMDQFDFEPIAALLHDPSREWEILRLAWYDYRSSISHGCENTKVRRCNQWVERNMCTIQLDLYKLHSSAAYMLPARSYDQFLTKGAMATDMAVLNQFKQTVLTPALCNQGSQTRSDTNLAIELTTERLFMKSCGCLTGC